MLIKMNNFLNLVVVTSLQIDVDDSLFDCPSCLAKPLERLLAIELLMFELKNVCVLCYGGKQIVRGVEWAIINKGKS